MASSRAAGQPVHIGHVTRDWSGAPPPPSGVSLRPGDRPGGWHRGGARASERVGGVRDREHHHVRANLQGRFVFQAVAVGMRKLFPAVAQVESAVDDGQLAVDA